MGHIGGLTFDPDSPDKHLKTPNVVAATRIAEAICYRYRLKRDNIQNALGALVSEGKLKSIFSIYRTAVSQTATHSGHFDMGEAWETVPVQTMCMGCDLSPKNCRTSTDRSTMIFLFPFSSKDCHPNLRPSLRGPYTLLDPPWCDVGPRPRTSPQPAVAHRNCRPLSKPPVGKEVSRGK